MLYKSIALFVLPLLSLHCGKDGKTCEMAAAEGGVKVPLTAGEDLTNGNCVDALGADAIVISGKEAVTCDEDPKVGEVCEKKTLEQSKTCKMAAAEGDVKVPLTAGTDLTNGNCVDALGKGATVKSGQAAVTCDEDPKVGEVCEIKRCALKKESGPAQDEANATGIDGQTVTNLMCAAVGDATLTFSKKIPLDCDNTDLTVKKYCEAKPVRCALTKENGLPADNPTKAQGNDGAAVNTSMCAAVGDFKQKNPPKLLDCGVDNLTVKKYCKPSKCALTKKNGDPVASPALLNDGVDVDDSMCAAVGDADLKIAPTTKKQLDCGDTDLTVKKYCKPAKCDLTKDDGSPATGVNSDRAKGISDNTTILDAMCAAVGDPLFQNAKTNNPTLDCGDDDLRVSKYCKPNRCALTKDDGSLADGTDAEKAFLLDGTNVRTVNCAAVTRGLAENVGGGTALDCTNRTQSTYCTR